MLEHWKFNSTHRKMLFTNFLSMSSIVRISTTTLQFEWNLATRHGNLNVLQRSSKVSTLFEWLIVIVNRPVSNFSTTLLVTFSIVHPSSSSRFTSIVFNTFTFYFQIWRLILYRNTHQSYFNTTQLNLF